MGIINRLPSTLIDRIAAGEVIERPASVVKELIENALDAGASQVEVEVEGGGLLRLTIADDGCGMSEDDARLAVERHATSKVRDPQDLFAIRTLGFRGEALSSIAAVSRLTLTTRRPQDAAGRRLLIEGGQLRSDEAYGCPPGTTLDVRDLFFNTPARRKFMKAPATEQAHIVEACTRVVLGHETAGLVLTVGERRLLDVPLGAPTVTDPGVARVLATIRQRARELHAFARGFEDVEVSGYLAPPDSSRRDAKGIWMFVNGRYVRDRALHRALLDAYGSLLERGHYPVAVVHLRLEPAAVDVNVHPQKLEVRFRDSGALYRAVCAAVTGALNDSALSQRRRPGGEVSAAGLAHALASAPYGGAEAANTDVATRYFEPVSAPRSAGSAVAYVAEPRASQPAFVARVGRYSIVRREDHLWLLDGVAARTRITYDRLRRQWADGGVTGVPMLFPEILEIPSHTERWLERNPEAYAAHGFELEPVGPGRWAARAVPAALHSETGVRSLIAEVLRLVRSGDDEAALRCSAAHAADDALDAVLASGQLDDVLENAGAEAVGIEGQPLLREITEAQLARLMKG